jgi:hypothetical protein
MRSGLMRDVCPEPQDLHPAASAFVSLRRIRCRCRVLGWCAKPGCDYKLIGPGLVKLLITRTAFVVDVIIAMRVYSWAVLGKVAARRWLLLVLELKPFDLAKP